MTDISDDAVRAFMAAEVPGLLDEHLKGNTNHDR